MKFLIVSVFALAPAYAAAAGVAHCVSIENDLQRLACYDEAAGRIEKPSPVTVSQAPAVRAESPRPVGAAPQPQAEVVKKRSQADTFGREHVADDDFKEITSRHVGEFTGWTGKTLFKLENGQVWRQAETERFRTRMDSPMITIRRGAFGSYRLKVEGLNRSIRVKRVR